VDAAIWLYKFLKDITTKIHDVAAADMFIVCFATDDAPALSDVPCHILRPFQAIPILYSVYGE